jgi:hypothetical protein
MSIPTQNSNNPQNWTNQAFGELFDGITARLPRVTFYAILLSYAGAAALSVWALHLPLVLSIPLALSIQTLRCLAVFSPFLNASGRATLLPEFIAASAALLNLFELSFSLQAMGLTGSEFYSLFLFGAGLIGLSMTVELQFLHQAKKAFGLVQPKASTSKGAVQMNQQQLATPTPLPAAPVPNVDVQALEDENKFLRDQVAQMQLGNGNAKPKRPKKIAPELLNGHSKSGNGNGKH